MAWKGERDGLVACGRCERTPPDPTRLTWAPAALWHLRPGWDLWVAEHVRVGCMRWEGPPCDACLVTRGSGAAFLFMPEAAGAISDGAISAGTISAGASSAGTISAGAISDGAISDGAISAGAISAGAISAGASSAGTISAGAISAGASSGASDATSPGAATSPPASTAGSTSITACVG